MEKPEHVKNNPIASECWDRTVDRLADTTEPVLFARYCMAVYDLHRFTVQAESKPACIQVGPNLVENPHFRALKRADQQVAFLARALGLMQDSRKGRRKSSDPNPLALVK